MKLDTSILVTKGSCFLLAAVSLQFGQALAQWANSGDHPSTLQWYIIAAGCVGAGANSIISFLSGSYSDYVKARSTGEHGPGPSTADAAAHPKPTPVAPADPPASNPMERKP